MRPDDDVVSVTNTNQYYCICLHDSKKTGAGKSVSFIRWSRLEWVITSLAQVHGIGVAQLKGLSRAFSRPCQESPTTAHATTVSEGNLLLTGIL